MTTVGIVESLWRYPIKSMSGEEMPEAFMGANAVLSSTVLLRRKTSQTAKFDRSDEHRAPCNSGKRRTERPCKMKVWYNSRVNV